MPEPEINHFLDEQIQKEKTVINKNATPKDFCLFTKLK
jgi:hypothetical protein